MFKECTSNETKAAECEVSKLIFLLLKNSFLQIIAPYTHFTKEKYFCE